MNKKDLSEFKRLNILDGTELLFAKNHTNDFPNHTHDTFNIALVINQTFHAKLSSAFLQAPVGTICITNPDEIHATPCDKYTGNTFITYYIAPTILRGLNHGVDVFFKDKVIYHPPLFTLFYQLAFHTENKTINFEKELINALSLLVKEYATEIKFKNQNSRLFQEFIGENSLEKFSLENTAKGFGLDKFKFLRLFKQETGLTPNSFIILKRIKMAKEMLARNEEILDVAIASGFYDAAHLSKEFKKYTGVTPGTYRNI
ncbi:AraC family transcriptional regulator [Pedobacter aquatilis]|uniref:AraC family transcriptional regulator n=1 Tax=Pedobacter aquatilis TaxID=351343 RepID=UPI00292D7688|nr:AraC family transcriptional regulator [Pedobacter aquatilis]